MNDLSITDVQVYLAKDMPTKKEILKIFEFCDYKWTKLATLVSEDQYFLFRKFIIKHYASKKRDKQTLEDKFEYSPKTTKSDISNFKDDINEMYKLFIQKAKGELSTKEVSIPYNVVRHPTKGYIKEFREDTIVEKIKTIPADEKAIKIAVELWRLYQDLEVQDGFESKDETTERYKKYLENLKKERAKFEES